MKIKIYTTTFSGEVPEMEGGDFEITEKFAYLSEAKKFLLDTTLELINYILDKDFKSLDDASIHFKYYDYKVFDRLDLDGTPVKVFDYNYSRYFFSIKMTEKEIEV